MRFYSFDHEWITGMAVGVEWIEDLFADSVNHLVIDLFILRLVIGFYKTEE
jgi:hypothetical protein